MATSADTLKTTFGRSACPADLPMYDAGIDPQGFKIPLITVVETALPHAKVLMYADTNHHNPLVTKPASSKPFLEALRDGGVTAIRMEVRDTHQPLIDLYTDGALTRPEFEEKVQADTNLKGNSVGDVTRAIGRTAEFSKDNHIDFRFADPGNGDADDRERFKDQDLATDLNAVQGKVFLQYGHAHFSSEEERKRIEGGLTKLDVYQNRQAYEGSKAGMAADNANGYKFNEAKPDLVYFQDTKTVHTTCATSPSLKAAVTRIGAELAPQPAAATPAPAVELEAAF